MSQSRQRKAWRSGRALRGARSRAAPADGARPGRRLSARAAGDVGAAAGPVRSAVHRLHEPGHGALSRRVPHQEPLDPAGRRHRARRHRGVPRLRAGAGRQDAGAGVRTLRPSQDGNRSAPRCRGRRDRHRMGQGLRARRDRSRDQAASAENGRDQSRRHVHHHAAAARRDRRALPQARRAALRRCHGLARRQRVRDGRLADRPGVGRAAEMPVGSARLGAGQLQRPRRRGDHGAQAHRARHPHAPTSWKATARSSARTISTSRC